MKPSLTWRRSIVSGGVVLAAYAMFLIMLAPAALIDAGLQRATHGMLRLAQATGTLWSGSGRLEIRDPGGHAGVGKDLDWTLQLRSLLHGQLDYQVSIDHADVRFPLHLSVRRIELSHVDFSLPAAALGMAVPRMAPLGLRGEIQFRIANFARASDAVSADAVMTWKDASSALTAVAPLGTYELRVDSAPGSMNARLRTLGGPLQLSGGGSWRGDVSSGFSVTARVDARHHDQLAPLLRLIAIEHGNGDFALQFNPPLDNVSPPSAPGIR